MVAPVPAPTWSPRRSPGRRATRRRATPSTFSVAIKNQGTVASASGAHGITLTVAQRRHGTVVTTLTGSLHRRHRRRRDHRRRSTWAPGRRPTAGTPSGSCSPTTPTSCRSSRPTTPATRPLFVGRGANMPYDMYEAEDGIVGGGAAVVGPNRTIGDLAGEASGRRAVTLNAPARYVQLTTRASTNTLVTRFSIPDAAGGGGISSTLNIYVERHLPQGDRPDLEVRLAVRRRGRPRATRPAPGRPRHIYDEANVMLGPTVPAGQHDQAAEGPGQQHDVRDRLHQPGAGRRRSPTRTRPATWCRPASPTRTCRTRWTGPAWTPPAAVGVYLPAGRLPDVAASSRSTARRSRSSAPGRGTPGSTRRRARRTPTPASSRRRRRTARRSADFAFFGNYTSRIDGPGKVFDFATSSNMTIDNIWVEHTVCLYWGANTDNSTIKNSRIRDTFADGINMTNGSTDNLVSNNEARATVTTLRAVLRHRRRRRRADRDNVFENLTATLTWRAAGLAVYGGYEQHVPQHLHRGHADLLRHHDQLAGLRLPVGRLRRHPADQVREHLARPGRRPLLGQPDLPRRSGLLGLEGVPGHPGHRRGHRRSDLLAASCSRPTTSAASRSSRSPTPSSPTSRSPARSKSGDAFDAKSGFGIWANELPEPGQGPAVGSATFNNLTFTNNSRTSGTPRQPSPSPATDHTPGAAGHPLRRPLAGHRPRIALFCSRLGHFDLPRPAPMSAPAAPPPSRVRSDLATPQGEEMPIHVFVDETKARGLLMAAARCPRAMSPLSQGTSGTAVAGPGTAALQPREARTPEADPRGHCRVSSARRSVSR